MPCEGFLFFINLTVIGNLKTFIIMAKIELRFLDQGDDSFVQTKSLGNLIRVEMGTPYQEESSVVDLDISTAIKFSKALRTEINKAKESEVSNG